LEAVTALLDELLQDAGRRVHVCDGRTYLLICIDETPPEALPLRSPAWLTHEPPRIEQRTDIGPAIIADTVGSANADGATDMTKPPEGGATSVASA
jgi:hypothetical protein